MFEASKLHLFEAVALSAVIPLTANSAHATMIFTEINQTASLSGQGIIEIDLNRDMVTDFILSVDPSGVGSIRAGGASEIGFPALVSVSTQSPFAIQLDEGDAVDSKLFDGSVATGSGIATLYDATGGLWSTTGDTGYVALQVSGAEGTNFGFLEITRGSLIAGTLGYQTDPGAAAVIPEPSSLVLLGLGGLLISRRRRG